MRHSILIAEDSLPFLQSLERAFRREFAPEELLVSGATSGLRALEVMSDPARRFDLLLSDIDLEDSVTGFDLAKKCSVERQGMHVVLMSGHQTLYFKARECGAAKFLLKPFPTWRAIVLVEELLGLKSRSTKSAA